MSQPFDNRDYDAQKLAERDAEIERLKADLVYHINLGIERCNREKTQRELIGELADAVDKYLNVDGSRKIYDAAELIAAAGNLDYQLLRAREAIRRR
jgi:hypothetical protein